MFADYITFIFSNEWKLRDIEVNGESNFPYYHKYEIQTRNWYSSLGYHHLSEDWFSNFHKLLSGEYEKEMLRILNIFLYNDVSNIIIDFLYTDKFRRRTMFIY